MKYPDLKSYIADVFKDEIAEAIQVFLDAKDDEYGRLRDGTRLTDIVIENIKIPFASFHDDIGDLVKLDANTTVDVVNILPYIETEVSRENRRFIFSATFEINKGIHDFKIYRVQNGHYFEPDPNNSLDEFLLPYISAEEFEDIADDFSERYCDSGYAYDNVRFPAEECMSLFGLKRIYMTLPAGTFARIYFKDSIFFIFDYIDSKCISVGDMKVSEGTIVINRNEVNKDFRSELDSIAHELIHWDKHKKFFEVLALLYDEKQLSCDNKPDLPTRWSPRLNESIWWAEWQASNLAQRVIMPRRIFEDELARNYDELFSPNRYYDAPRLEEAICKTAKRFGVSEFDVKLRAIQLGITEAAGTLIFNGKYVVFPISFKRESLGKNQTYDICEDSYNKLLESDEDFADLIKIGRYVYAEDSFVVLNDPLYVMKSDDPNRNCDYTLTSYGRRHADECCMKFELKMSYGKYDMEYSGQCFLAKQFDSNVLYEKRMTYALSEQDMNQKREISRLVMEDGRVINSIYRNLPNSFNGTLIAHMDRLSKDLGFKFTNKMLSARTGLSEDYIGQLKKDENTNPSLQTVCAICVGLNLPPKLSKDLLKKAKVDFPDTDEGYYQESLLDRCYSEPLQYVNQLLALQNIKTWSNL